MSFKKKVHATCVHRIDEKLESIQKEVGELKKSLSSETKSSMGDKYETAREMINLEKGKLSEQLEQFNKMKLLLKSIDPEKELNEVKTGAHVTTLQGEFYVSVGLGGLHVDDKKVFAISPVSPIGQAMLDKKVGDTFSINGRDQKILSVS